MSVKLDHWGGVEVRHLATLAAIAAEGSFRRAARRLGYSQAAISAQVATLERLLDARLLDRRPGRGRVTLTAAGRVALAHADAIVDRLAAAQADIEAAGRTNTLRLGVFQSIGARLLPQLVVGLREIEEAPQLTVIEDSTDAAPLELLAAGEVDLSFAMLPLPDGPFATTEILREPFVLLASRTSPLAGRASVALSDLRELPLIAGRSCRATAAAEAAAQTAAGRLTIAVRSDDNETIRALVAAGVGVSLVPRLLVGDGNDGVVAVPLDDDLPPRRICIAWNTHRHRNQAVDQVIDLSRAIAGRL